MEATTCERLQELGAFVLAGACKPPQLCKMAEMIRAARDYRWVGIYKITRGDFVIAAKTGTCPPAYPRFPITQGLAGAAVESKRQSWRGRHKDLWYYHVGSTQSENVVPVSTSREVVV